MRRFIFLTMLSLLPLALAAEDGSRLWLRFDKAGVGKEVASGTTATGSATAATGVPAGATVVAKDSHPSVEIARRELAAHWRGVPVELRIDRKLERLGEGYKITGGAERVTVSAPRAVGLLYGAYHLLRLQETGAWSGAGRAGAAGSAAQNLDIEETPRYDLRILNHWDNLDGSIERGYAGGSLWRWEELPEVLSPRYGEYARANASVGINATVINNVNAAPEILSAEYLAKVKALADVFRPYGVRVFLAVNFSSPAELGGLADSDPLNPAVVKWWREKAAEIYALVPDFGGFLVKANSEGLPGPHDYGRTHAEGANMLADALKPFGGIVMWRAFVYNPDGGDRAGQAYREFVPLDGEFRENVIIQIKNGPVDFQPREPFSPLFGAMRKTAQMVELQITQEYLGHSNHLVYLAPLFREALDADTWCEGEGSTVARITDGTLRPVARLSGKAERGAKGSAGNTKGDTKGSGLNSMNGRNGLSAIAGVANTGDDTNWCGHHFAQANWYAFGRLAWDPGLSSEQIADEWLRMTFTRDDGFVGPVKDMMLSSREACVDYMMPLGLHHLFAWEHHYGPQPWCDVPGARPDWMPSYYHNAGADGVGFDRTVTRSNNTTEGNNPTEGSGSVTQYFPPLDALYGDPATCPDGFLLWFHHLPWDFRMKNGETLWDALCRRYDTGVQAAREYQKVWDRIEGRIDTERFRDVQSKLKIQTKDAVWWKDACLLYFQTFSELPIPYDIERPVHELEDLKKINLDLK